MRELESVELATEYARQLKHAARRQADAQAFLGQHPSRGLEYAWRDGPEPRHVVVDHQFYQGIVKAVSARARDLCDTGPQGEWQTEHILRETAAEVEDPFGPDDPNAPR